MHRNIEPNGRLTICFLDELGKAINHYSSHYENIIALGDFNLEVEHGETNFSEFNNRVETVLNEHAPMKKKCIRANDGPFMTKALRKAIFTRTNLCNRYNSNRTLENWNAFKGQRNKCVKILRQAKIDYYKNLDMKFLTDNRKFWKTVKPLFSEKMKASSKINLLENEVLVSDDREVADIFNEYFIHITEALGIHEPKDILTPIDGLRDPIEAAIKKYSSHPSIQLIFKNKKSSNEFGFNTVVKEKVAAALQKLKLNKANPVGSIPGKILKDNQDIFTNMLQKLFNDSVIKGIFPPELKIGEITPVYKANDQTSKTNYRPITVLSAISKIYERLMFEQVIAHSESFLS